jgi:hypothetical protein
MVEFSGRGLFVILEENRFATGECIALAALKRAHFF